MIPIAKPYLTEDEANHAYETIMSGWVAQGPRVEEFEGKFSQYTGSRYSVAVSNCTTALHLAMIVEGIGKGDEVICPSMSYIATANSIRYVGADPVFAEIDPENFNMDADHVEKLITEKTKAILLVHQIGMPADIDRFKLLSEKYKISIIEDAACAVGSGYKERKIGSHSELVCFSFHPRKVMTTGEGGMITTNREDYYKRLKLLRQHAMTVDAGSRHTAREIVFEDHTEVGYNYRMTDIQASIGIEQLRKLDNIIEQRREIASRYINELQKIDSIRLPVEAEGYFSNYQSFCIYLKPHCTVNRNDLMKKLLDAGISSRRGIMTAHRETAYKDEFKDVKLPVSEEVSDRSIMVPLFVPMDEKDVSYIISTLKKFLRQ